MRLRAAVALLLASGASVTPATVAPGPFDVLFNHSLARERAARSVSAWRRTRKTPVDLLIGNYLSDYFKGLAEAITSRQARFRRPRRTDGHPFYERCLPKMLVLSPWRADLPAVTPAGRWDWFVFDNETDAFWSSIRPLATRVLDDAFAKCGLTAAVGTPAIHFRCASAPLNRQSQYHFQRYSFFRSALRRWTRMPTFTLIGPPSRSQASALARTRVPIPAHGVNPLPGLDRRAARCAGTGGASASR